PSPQAGVRRMLIPWRAKGVAAGLALAASATLVALPETAAATAVVTPAAVTPINNLARTPYQGWNTYYGLGSTFNEQTIKDEADAIVNRGLKAAGYNYVWIDGGWW